MKAAEWIEYKLRATKIICWSGVVALICGGIPVAAILCAFSVVWAAMICLGILGIQLIALTLVWSANKPEENKPAVIPPSPLLQQTLESISSRVEALETMDRVDRKLTAER